MLTINSWLLNAVMKIHALWNPRYKGLSVRGPFSYSTKEFQTLRDFRKQQNLIRAPYLENSDLQNFDVENAIDQRSYHFALYRTDELLATVRLTSAPFELDQYWMESQIPQSINGFFEFSRLCTKIDLSRKGFYARLLVVQAAMYLFKQNQATGIVGMCRPETIGFLQKLGLAPGGISQWIPERASHYHLVYSRKENLIPFHLTNFTRELFHWLKTKDQKYEHRYLKAKASV